MTPMIYYFLSGFIKNLIDFIGHLQCKVVTIITVMC